MVRTSAHGSGGHRAGYTSVFRFSPPTMRDWVRRGVWTTYAHHPWIRTKSAAEVRMVLVARPGSPSIKPELNGGPGRERKLFVYATDHEEARS